MLAVTILLTVAVGTMTVWVLVNAYRIRSLPPLIPPSTLGAGIVMYWLLGHAALFADHERLKRLIAKHGRHGAATVWFFTVPTVIFVSEDLHQAILGQKQASGSGKQPAIAKVAAGRMQSQVWKEFGGLVTFQSDNPQFAVQRKFIHMFATSPNMVRQHFAAFKAEVYATLCKLAEQADAKAAFDPHTLLKLTALNYVLRITLGRRLEHTALENYHNSPTLPDNANDTRLLHTIERMGAIFFAPSLGAFYWWLAPIDPVCRESKVVTKNFADMVAKRVAEYDQQQKSGEVAAVGEAPMLAELVKQLKAGTMTMDDVVGIIKSILGAGTNSVSSIFENFVQLLCNHPTVMKKLQDELDAVVGPDRLVNEEDLPNLKYFWQTVKATMVVRPLVAFSVSRAATDDFQWREFTIIKGTALWGLWPNVHEPFEQSVEFNPDLYADDPMLDVNGTRNVANTSFGGGLRVCVGARLAQMELLVLLANMCHLFSWSTADGKPCPQSVLQVMRIKPQRTKLLFTKRRDVGALIAAQE